MLGLGNKDSEERCTGLYCELSSHQVKVGESQRSREWLLVHQATVPWITGSLLSWLWQCSVFKPSGYHALPDTTPHSALSAQGNWSHSARMSPSCQANLPSQACLDHMRRCSWELCNMLCNIGPWYLGWADWAVAQQTGPGALPELSISQTSSH